MVPGKRSEARSYRMKRVLFISHEPVGAQMAGPGIRYVNLARELSRRFEVTLLAPHTQDADVDGVRVIGGRSSYGRVKDLVTAHDVLVAQQLGVRTMLRLARMPIRTVYDLYVPIFSENLAYYAAQPDSGFHPLSYRAGDVAQSVALATGDAFICAGERQRDLWLGRLSELERIDIPLYRRDPALRTVVGIVPIGLSPEPPKRGQRVLKGVVPGIGDDDKVLLWAGGVWDWFDPLTVIRAVARLSERRGDVRLYFMGLRHPSPGVGQMQMTQRAVSLARELGVVDRSVFFNFGWVPYEKRASYLLEASVGVSAHFDTVETRFAHRTRLLDHFWAGLPTVTTGGDELGELIERRGLGRVVGFEDVDGWLEAVDSLLDDEGERRRIARNLQQVRGELSWPRVAERLAKLVDGNDSLPPSPYARELGRRYARIQARVAIQRPSLVLRHLRTR